MARRKRASRPEEDEPGLNISSLIDVCFLLLIYFLVTSQIVRKEQELSTTLPANSRSDTPPELSPFLILLEANGHISSQDESGSVQLLDSDPNNRDLPTLTERLALYRDLANSQGQQPLVQIRVDGDAVQQRVIDILNVLGGLKITAITFTDIADSAL